MQILCTTNKRNRIVLNVVANKSTLANTFTNEEPAGNLCNNYGINSGFADSCCGPLESQNILNETSRASDDLPNLSRGGGS